MISCITVTPLKIENQNKLQKQTKTTPKTNEGFLFQLDKKGIKIKTTQKKTKINETLLIQN